MRVSKTTTKPKVATVWLDASDLETWQTPEGRARIETQADRLDGRRAALGREAARRRPQR